MPAARKAPTIGFGGGAGLETTRSSVFEGLWWCWSGALGPCGSRGSETGHWCVYAAPVTFSMAGVDLELGIRLSQGWGRRE